MPNTIEFRMVKVMFWEVLFYLLFLFLVTLRRHTRGSKRREEMGIKLHWREGGNEHESAPGKRKLHVATAEGDLDFILARCFHPLPRGMAP